MKFFTLMAFAMSLFVSHLDGVGMSPLAFKNVNQFFKHGLEYNSPIFGCAALNTGVIENLRFYNVKPVYKADGKRDYINDNVPGNEPIMEMVKILFPSSAGLLTSETTNPSNFGRNCQPEHVAFLLNFCHKLRGLENINNLSTKINLALKKIGYSDEIAKSFPIKKGEGAGFNQAELDVLLKSILIAIKNEVAIFFQKKEGSVNSFYPKYFPEQVITAFFCHKFSDQSHIKIFLKALIPEIVNEDMVENINNLIDAPLVQDDLELALKKTEDFSLDDHWIILNREEFFRTLPYRFGSPISNGLARRYNRGNDELLQDEKTLFADCVEVTLRHIINFFLYDSKTNSFNCNYLNAYCQQEKDKDFAAIKNLKHFYGYFDQEDVIIDSTFIQTPGKANAGSEPIRSAWNKVVANLDDPNIIYCKKYDEKSIENDNELCGGMLTIASVLNKLFCLNFECPTHQPNQDDLFIQEGQSFVLNCFQKLFGILNPTLSCSLEIEDIKMSQEQEKKEISGKISVDVQDQSLQNLFSFTIKAAPFHAEVSHLTINQKVIPEVQEAAQSSIRAYCQDAGTRASLLLLDARIDQKAAPLLYQLLEAPLDDSNAIVKFLDLIAEVQLNEKICLITQNLLNIFPWNDFYAVQDISPVIRDIFNRKDGFFDNIKNSVMELALEDGDSPEFISQFKNLKYLVCSQTNGIKNVIIPAGMDSLEVINLFDSGVKKVTLASAPKLKEIKLWCTKNLEELVISDGMDSLEEINIGYSGVKEVTFAAAPKLKKINLDCTSNLGELVISAGMDSLEEINLYNSGVRKITLAATPKLKRINLSSTKNLEELVISDGMDSLEEINLSYSGVKKVTLAAAPKLKKINLRWTSKLEGLVIPAGMDSLEEINLINSGVRKVTLAAAPQLKSICYEDRDQEKKINISGVSHCPQLDQKQLLKFAILKDDESESCKRKRSDEAGENPEKRQRREKSDDSDDMDAD